MGVHSSYRHAAKQGKGCHRKPKRGRIEPYSWLGAGAVTFGVGAALVAGAGQASADSGPSADSSSSSPSAGPSAAPATKTNIKAVHVARPNHTLKSSSAAGSSPSGDDTSTHKAKAVKSVATTDVATLPHSNPFKLKAFEKSKATGAAVSSLVTPAIATQSLASSAAPSSAQSASPLVASQSQVTAAADPYSFPIFNLDPEIYPPSSGVVTTGSKAYVTASDGLHVIDIPTDPLDYPVLKVLPIPAGTIDYQNGLNNIALSANGKSVYVAGTALSTNPAQQSKSYVTTVDTVSDTVKSTVQLVDTAHPGNAVYATSATLSQDGKRLFVPGVSVGPDAPFTQYVWAVDTTTNKVIGQIGLPAENNIRLNKVGVSPDGSLVYVGISSDDETNQSIVDAIDLSGDVVRTLSLQGSPDVQNVTVSPDGKSVFVLASASGDQLRIYGYDSTTGEGNFAYSVQASASNTLPSFVISPNGQRLYISTTSSDNAGKINSVISVVDLATGNVINRSILSEPQSVTPLGGLAVSPDGSRVAYMLQSSNYDPSAYTAELAQLDVGGGDEGGGSTPTGTIKTYPSTSVFITNFNTVLTSDYFKQYLPLAGDVSAILGVKALSAAINFIGYAVKGAKQDYFGIGTQSVQIIGDGIMASAAKAKSPLLYAFGATVSTVGYVADLAHDADFRDPGSTARYALTHPVDTIIELQKATATVTRHVIATVIGSLGGIFGGH